MVYLIHVFDKSLRFKHYCGYSAANEISADNAILNADIHSRVLTRAKILDTDWKLVRVWINRGTKWVKACNRSGPSQYCPVCKSARESAKVKGYKQKTLRKTT